jgi:hypothetical protein
MKWVKCTSAVESSVPLWVNLEQVIVMFQSEQGTEMKGSDGFVFVVTDTPEDILQRCEMLRS